MAFAPILKRLQNFARAFGLTAAPVSPAGNDAELNQIMSVVNVLNMRQRAITSADGRLKNLAQATAMALVGAERFVATASQTEFTTAIDWDSDFTALNVFVTVNGVMVDTNDVSVDDNGGFLRVTVPAQVVSNVVFVSAFEPGAGILTRLQALTNGDGASIIGVEDAAGNFNATTVEDVLAELADLIAAIDATLTALSANAILRDGSVAFTANQSMGGFKLTNLAAGTAGSNDAARMADITSAALVVILGTYLSTTYLALSGGTMTGAINMGSNKITSLDDGDDSGDAVNKGQLDLKLSLAGGTMTGDIDMDGNTITGADDAVADSDVPNLAQVRALLASFSEYTEYAAPGAATFVVPAGVYKIRVRLWGGGGGSSASIGAVVAYGGGGGAYVEVVIDVTPGETLTLNIGAGGAATADGGDTEILRSTTSLALAGGGSNGTSGSGDGVGGVYTIGAGIEGFGIDGGDGDATVYAVAATESIAQYIGGGGNSPMGGQGGRRRANIFATTYGTLLTPGEPGGGGSYSGGAGAAGAAGRIIVNY